MYHFHVSQRVEKVRKINILKIFYMPTYLGPKVD